MLFNILAVMYAAGGILTGVSAQNATCAREYTVQSGDYCDRISASQGASTYQLAFVNHASVDAACDNLNPGQVLCLGMMGEDCMTSRVVQPGDTCLDVASAAGISVNILMANNPNINGECTNIYPDEVLCTSGVAIIYTLSV